MTKFVVTYHGSAAALEKMSNATPEEMAEGMKPWMAWAERIGDGLVDWGTPLAGGQRLSKSGASPSNSGVVGYPIIQAENIGAAQALLDGHPHLYWAPGCEIEVHECMPTPM